MDAYIAGIGWVTGNGAGWGSQGGECLFSELPLPSLSRKEVFAEPNQRFGRQSDYSKLGLAAIAFALRDAGLEKWSEKRPIGVVAATRLGCLVTDLEYQRGLLPGGGRLASPNLFAYTLANCFLGEAAIQFGLTGSSYAINAQDSGDLAALSLALESLAFGDAETMLAGVCDLGAPEGFGAGVPLQPGALFLVLTLAKPDRVRGYGSITLTENRTLLKVGGALAGLEELVGSLLPWRPGLC